MAFEDRETELPIQIVEKDFADISDSAEYDAGAVANELLMVQGYFNQLNRFYDIELAEGIYLDYLGGRLGSFRRDGESNLDFYNRIFARLTGEKLTPYGFEQALKIFSPNFVLIQEGLGGFGYVGRSFYGYVADAEAGYDKTTDVVVTEAVGGITLPNTFQVADTSLFDVGCEIWHDDDDVMYRVKAKTASTLVVDIDGYVDGVYTTDVLSISGSASGNLTKHENAIVKKAYIGSVSTGLLRIRVTIESNDKTNDPVIAKFLVDLLEEIKVPGSVVEIVKITL